MQKHNLHFDIVAMSHFKTATIIPKFPYLHTPPVSFLKIPHLQIPILVSHLRFDLPATIIKSCLLKYEIKYELPCKTIRNEDKLILMSILLSLSLVFYLIPLPNLLFHQYQKKKVTLLPSPSNYQRPEPNSSTPKRDSPTTQVKRGQLQHA